MARLASKRVLRQKFPGGKWVNSSRHWLPTSSFKVPNRLYCVTSCKWKSLKKAALGCRIPSRTSSSSCAHFCSISAIVCSCLIRPLSRLNTSFITSHTYLYSSLSVSVACISSIPCTVLVSPKCFMAHRSTSSSMTSVWMAWRKLGRNVGAGTAK